MQSPAETVYFLVGIQSISYLPDVMENPYITHLESIESLTVLSQGASRVATELSPPSFVLGTSVEKD
jgi:hypothetical protein